jgi:hypothetical protein
MKTLKPEVPGTVLTVVACFISGVIQAFGPGSVRIVTHPITPARTTARGGQMVDNMAPWCKIRGGQAD